MATRAENFQFTLTVTLNQQGDKVLYATVSRGFVDVLLSFLILPLGTIVRLLLQQYKNEAPGLGSLNSLYKGLKDLDITEFYWRAGKWMLLKPRNSFGVQCRKLKLKIDDTAPIKYYICQNFESRRCSKDVGMYYDDLICSCGNSVNLEVCMEDSNVKTPSGGVFVTSLGQSFVVTDNLQIFPDLQESALQILRGYGVEDTKGLQEITVSFGYLEMMKLLKCSLVSKTPLTDTILNERTMIPAKVNTGPVPFVPEMVKDFWKLKSKKMKARVFVQQSTNRILSLEAREDFVDFLFSLLTIPLGKAEFLLHGNTCLGSMDNLYRSVPDLIGREHVKDHSINSLLNPQLPPNYVSMNQILPLTQQSSHTLLYSYSYSRGRKRRHLKMSSSHNFNHVDDLYPSRLIDRNGLKPNYFMVTDDLVVTISTANSGVSKLQTTGIPLHDVKSYVLDIGMEEAVNILKASLTSSFALTNGLKQCLRRQQSKKNIVHGEVKRVLNRQIMRLDIILALCVLAFSALFFFAIAYSDKRNTKQNRWSAP